MAIVLTSSAASVTPEWALIELQGELNSEDEGDLAGKFVGDLHYTKKGVPILIIDHHVLMGKVVEMDKPFAVLEKQQQQRSNSSLPISGTCGNHIESTSTTYVIRAIVTRKLAFRTRPKPIIADVPQELCED